MIPCNGSHCLLEELFCHTKGLIECILYPIMNDLVEDIKDILFTYLDNTEDRYIEC